MAKDISKTDPKTFGDKFEVKIISSSWAFESASVHDDHHVGNSKSKFVKIISWLQLLDKLDDQLFVEAEGPRLRQSHARPSSCGGH